MAEFQTDPPGPEASRILSLFKAYRSFEWLACEVVIAVRDWSRAGPAEVSLDLVFERFWPTLDFAGSASPADFLAGLERSGLLTYTFSPVLGRPLADTVDAGISSALVAWLAEGASGATVRDTGLMQALRKTIGFSLTKTRDTNVPGAEIYVSALPEAEGAAFADVAVLMPFHGSRRAVFDRAIRPACEAAGLSCRRADEFYGSKHIISEIFSLIKGSRIVVSDISGLNANVMYETGISHAIGRNTLILAERGTRVPFDVMHLRRIEYARGLGGLGALRAGLKTALEELAPGRSPT